MSHLRLAQIEDVGQIEAYQKLETDTFQSTLNSIRPLVQQFDPTEENTEGGVRFVFRICPFKGTATGDNTWLFVHPNYVKAGCHADKCGDKGWPDLQKIIGWKPSTVEKQETKPSAAAALIRFAQQNELFHFRDESYITIAGATHKVDSPEFREWLRHEYYSWYKRPPNKNAITDAVATVQANAKFDGHECPVLCRYGVVDGRHYLELGNGKVAEIDADGWRVVPCPKHVKFIRTRGQLPLPHPQTGDIGELRQYVNVADDRSWHLLVAGLLACLMPAGPYWIVLILSPHGSGKTTILRMLRPIIDPHEADVRTAPRDEHSLMLAARYGLLASIDNVSKLPEWLCDALCRLATGAGMAQRKYYTQDEEHVMFSQRPAIITTIADLTGREDFLSRCLLVQCAAIPPDKRKAESMLLVDFDAARPRILGALLTAVSAAIKNLPNTHPDKLPRMADAFRWVVACEAGLGWESGKFAGYFAESEAEITSTILENPVAVALQAAMTKQDEWSGSGAGVSLLAARNE